ncbi:MAG: T9SS type A sorting domain-containing protein [Bacteroidales bacterium]|nr:T9SS type A sorting domain-containing protein [Bacteroidales bacterium]
MMKKLLVAIVGILFCITANSQEINAVVTRQDKNNNGWYQLSSQPSAVLGENDAISIVVNGQTKETYTLSDDNTLTILFGSAINEEVNTSNLTVSHPILIQRNGILNVSGTMTNTKAEDLVIGDGGQLVTGSSVHATLEKEITGSTPSKASDVNWYTISSPLAAGNTAFANVTNLIPSSGVTGTDYDLYRLDETNGEWVNSRLSTGANPEFTTIDKGIGYIYHNKANTELEFKGATNTDNVAVNLTSTGSKGNGFNLIGNPFTQNIQLSDVVSQGEAELADGFYVLTNQNTWGTKLTDSEIKPLQGFLVQAKTAGDVTISKPTSSSKGERSNEQSTNIEIIVSNSSYTDNAYAMFGEGIGLNKVSHRNAEAPMLYVPQDGEDFAIAFMDENTTVFPVSFKAMTTGSYSISLKPTDDVSTLVLVDNMTGIETDMLLGDSYPFIGSPRDNENRFTVKLKISNSQDENEHFAYQNGNELVINGEGMLQIFDVLGRVVIIEEVHGQTVNVSRLNTGAYIVRLTGESVKTQKIVVR